MPARGNTLKAEAEASPLYFFLASLIQYLWRTVSVLLDAGQGRDAVSFAYPDEANALRGAADDGNVPNPGANELPPGGDKHEFIVFDHAADADDGPRFSRTP